MWKYLQSGLVIQIASWKLFGLESCSFWVIKKNQVVSFNVDTSIFVFFTKNFNRLVKTDDFC